MTLVIGIFCIFKKKKSIIASKARQTNLFV
jgi:hypothetical protein